MLVADCMYMCTQRHTVTWCSMAGTHHGSDSDWENLKKIVHATLKLVQLPVSGIWTLRKAYSFSLQMTFMDILNIISKDVILASGKWLLILGFALPDVYYKNWMLSVFTRCLWKKRKLLLGWDSNPRPPAFSCRRLNHSTTELAGGDWLVRVYRVL